MNFNSSDIIIFDTETTGLDAASPTKIEKQPYITEFYGVRLTKDFKFVDDFDTMIKPPIPISNEITRITGISDADVELAPTFIQVYDNLYNLFENCRNVSGHNVMFDLRLLKYELFRLDKEHAFNWPKNHICTVEASRHYMNKRLKLQQLYEFLFNETFENAHRAKNDVMATVKCFIEMVKRGDITL